jgi:DNA-nicking Smr family endonuclease
VRSLGPDEAELWRRVTATIRPLSRETSEPATPEPPAAAIAANEPAPARPKVKGRVPPPRAPKAAPPPPRPRPGNTLDGTWDRKLRSGALEPDRILDLHGMNLDGAWSALDGALERSIAAGDRVLLLITGHARAGEPPILRGRIRAAVHDWLAASRHATRIAAVRGAHRRHGGGGSLYIVLRRS